MDEWLHVKGSAIALDDNFLPLNNHHVFYSDIYICNV